MGLFDFAREIGEKLFTSDAEAAVKISTYIAQNNPGIDDLNVIFNDGTATVIGVTGSSEAAQKAILMTGNVEGVEKVVSKIDITGSGDSEVDLESGDVDYYVIESGDTLSKIAQRVYGNAGEYTRIFEANREVIKDPDKIYVGQKIRIPH